ncbi:MAG: DUF4132 domain-containing protein [Micromonosporaceae bacterium]
MVTLPESAHGADAAQPSGDQTEAPSISWALPDDSTLATILDVTVDKAAYQRALQRQQEQRGQAERRATRFGFVSQPLWSSSPKPKLPDDPTAHVRALLLDPQLPQQDDFGLEMYLDLERAAALPGLPPAGLTKLLIAAGHINKWQRPLMSSARFFDIHHRATGRTTLLELARLLDDCGHDGTAAVMMAYLNPYLRLGAGWAADAVWPFFERHLDQLFAHKAEMDSYYEEPTGFFQALASFPTLPEAAVEKLYELALGTRKADRAPARELLKQHPDRTRRAIAGLGAGKSSVRQAATTWLADIQDPGAVPALEQALAKERQDVVKGTMLDALLALGQPVEPYLNRDDLHRTAARAVVKALPKALAWFPQEALPAVRWADTGDELPPDVLTWLVIVAVKAKTPEPNALLRHHCGMLRPEERQRLGRFLFEAWLTEANSPTSLGGHAASCKGLLALVAACAGPEVVEPVGRCLKQWGGDRSALSKALLAVLAWIDHPSATQLLLSVAAQFRTKNIQEEANRLAGALAERRGWTVAELADRAVPTAGFDILSRSSASTESGVLELSYGPRAFTATLTPELTVQLRSPEGKPIKALPAPRAIDDEADAKAAKKTLAAAKKELKSIATLQTARLYEALCTERTWSAEDWSAYLTGHPVMRHLTQRLVWTATAPDGAELVTFRLLDDGTLTNVDDDEVKLPDGSTVGIAHDSNLPPDEVTAWLEHLADYEVSPLFQQFGKGTYQLPEERRSALAIEDFKGHMLQTYALRGRATKLGYVRGPAEDGGFFYEYRKLFPTLGITAIIGFTGNLLPEENRDVALEDLTFERQAPTGQTVPARLGDVPTVLLSETWNDMRLIATEGAGYDSDWEERAY